MTDYYQRNGVVEVDTMRRGAVGQAAASIANHLPLCRPPTLRRGKVRLLLLLLRRTRGPNQFRPIPTAAPPEMPPPLPLWTGGCPPVILSPSGARCSDGCGGGGATAAATQLLLDEVRQLTRLSLKAPLTTSPAMKEGSSHPRATAFPHRGHRCHCQCRHNALQSDGGGNRDSGTMKLQLPWSRVPSCLIRAPGAPHSRPHCYHSHHHRQGGGGGLLLCPGGGHRCHYRRCHCSMCTLVTSCRQ